MKGVSIFWKVLFSFMVFGLTIIIFLGIFIFWSADKLGEYLLLQQVQPVMFGLIEADRNDFFKAGEQEINRFADAINGTFLKGGKVPSHWATRPTGLYIDKRNFIYICHANHTVYSLSGSASPLREFVSAIGKTVILTGCLGLLLGCCISWFLSRHLASPLEDLTKTVEDSEDHAITIPCALSERNDEIGILSKAIMRQQKEALEYWRRELSFTGDVSHELRTPFAIMQGAVELIRTKPVPSELEPLLQRMEETIAGMTATLQSLLILARKEIPPLESLLLDDFIRKEIHFLEQNEAKRVELSASGPITVKGRRELTATIVRNLFRNAFQYSHPDEPIILRIEPDSMLFCNKAASNPSGSGLGLSIAERCCAKMGWKLAFNIVEGNAIAKISWPTTSSL